MSNFILNEYISRGEKCIFDYILCHYNAMIEQVLHELSVIPNIRNDFEIIATLHEAQTDISQWRERTNF